MSELSYTRNQSQLKKNWKKILKCRCCVIKRERTRREKCTPGIFKNLFFVVKKKMKFIVSFFFRITTVVQAKIPEIKKFYIKIYDVKKIKVYDTNIYISFLFISIFFFVLLLFFLFLFLIIFITLQFKWIYHCIKTIIWR